jgi:trimethylamine--corrinoid protein Co-methyltransferase
MANDTAGDPRLPPHDVLSERQLEEVVEAALTLLRETGVKFDPHPEALGHFREAGCDVSSEGIVRFPTPVVRDALDALGRTAKLWNRSGTECVELGAGATSYFAGGACINVIDPYTGERRPSTSGDVAAITRIADSLASIDGVILPCKITERPGTAGEVEEFAVMARGTRKPLEYLCESETALAAAIEMASAIRGGSDALKKKPYFCFSVSPLPLYYTHRNVEQLLLAVRAGIPLELGTMSIGGASAPVTVAGNLVHCIATELAGLVLAQRVERGICCMGGSVVGFMDPLTTIVGAVPELLLADLAMCQVSRHLGMPRVSGMAGVAASPRFDPAAVAVISLSMFQSVHGRADLYKFLGILEGGLTYSAASLLLCDELASMVRRFGSGIRVDEDTLALDLAKSLGPQGDFLGELHTARHCRTELWDTRYFRSLTNEAFGAGGGRDLSQRLAEDAREILETHEVEPLPEALDREIGAILQAFGGGVG